jgi:hypothetical protein
MENLGNCFVLWWYIKIFSVKQRAYDSGKNVFLSLDIFLGCNEFQNSALR